MAKDESKRRTNISVHSLSTEWTAKGSRNKLTNEVEVMYMCPECGHHAFHVSPNAGRFHCWYCGIYGRFAETRRRETPTPLPAPLPLGGWGGMRAASGLMSSPSFNSPSQKKSEATNTPDYPQAALPLGGAGRGVGEAGRGASTSQLDDYMPLDADDLDEIEDISLDESVGGAQLAVRNYLQSQRIPLEWAVKMRWGVSMRHIKVKGEENGKMRACLVFRNYVEGYCCNAKFRSVSTKTKTRKDEGRKTKDEGRKTMDNGLRTTVVWEKGFDQLSSYSPCAPYNIDCIRDAQGQEVLFITEGEKDCLTLRMMGYTYVISAASGAQTDHAKSFEAFTEWLSPFRSVTIVGDQDCAGRMMVQNLISYFDDKQIRVARWDKRIMGKDITEVYQQHGMDVARQLVENATPVVREDIEDFLTDEAVAETIESARGNYDHGYPTGVGPVTDTHFKLFNLGGLIIVTGTPNTGKTDFLNYLSMSLLNQRRSHVCYCSFETPNKCRHAGDLTQIWAGGTDLTTLTADEITPFARCVMSHITHIRMRREKPTPEAVLRKAEIVKQMHPQMEYLIIDPYLYLSMTQGRNITETDSIKSMLTTVQDWAHKHHVWVFIVAHPRKLQKDDGTKELEEVDMYTIAGSANWANVADYVISVKRIQTRGLQGQVTADYTRMSVLKVRDQKICVPGDVFYNRQSSGRYDERSTEKDAQACAGSQNLEAWRTD